MNATQDLMSMSARIEDLELLLADVTRSAEKAAAARQVENAFGRYQYLHNAFRDDLVVDLWVSEGTPGISAQYSNSGVYTDWASVMAYHRDRPAPPGKLINHYATMPVIEVADDLETAQGMWLLAGTESGLVDPEVAPLLPAQLLSPGEADGKRVWAHWVWAKYFLTFLRQDAQWRIWKFRCVEIARTPYERNWISFAEENMEAYERDIAYFGDNGRPVFMPPPNEPALLRSSPYRPRLSAVLDPVPPAPYASFEG